MSKKRSKKAVQKPGGIGGRVTPIADEERDEPLTADGRPRPLST